MRVHVEEDPRGRISRTAPPARCRDGFGVRTATGFRWEEGTRVATEAVPGADLADGHALVDLVPMLRRVVGARIKDPHSVDDLVQETLARVMSARARVAPDRLPHYASRTARNLVASYAEKNDRARDRSHLLADEVDVESAATDILRQEERRLVGIALGRLSAGDRDVLVAHEVNGEDTLSMAAGQIGRASCRERV